MDSLLLYLLRTSAFLTLFTALYWLFLRKETFFALNRFFLLAGAALSFLLPLLKVPSPFKPAVITAPPYPYADAILPGSLPAAPALTPLAVVSFVYLAGVAFLFILFSMRIIGLFLAVRRCGCRPHQGLRVVLCPGRSEPFSFFRYIFLDRTALPAGEFDRILAHELVHVRQFHSLDVILTELVTTILWFNPFVWPYRLLLRETHEYLADRAVIAQGCSRTGYQRLIVEQHVGGKLFEYASNFRNSQIKRRLTMLSRRRSQGPARLKLLLGLPLALLLVLAFAEPRTTVSSGSQEVAADAAHKTSSAQEKSEEEAVSGLKKKFAKLEQAKSENASKIAALREAYDAAQDPAEKEKLMKAIKEHKQLGHDLNQKELSLHIKKMEMAYNNESDPAKKDMLLKKMQELQLKVEPQSQPSSAVEANGAASLELEQKKIFQMMKKVEMALKAENDPAKKEELSKKYEDLKAQAEVNAKAMQAAKEAELKAKAEQDKKNN